MIKKIQWFINNELNIDEIKDFQSQIKNVELLIIQDAFNSSKYKVQPYYLLYKDNKKKSPWQIYYGFYNHDGSHYTIVKKTMYEGRVISNSWKVYFGVEEHLISNEIYLSDNSYSIKKLQKKLNQEHNNKRQIKKSELVNGLPGEINGKIYYFQFARKDVIELGHFNLNPQIYDVNTSYSVDERYPSRKNEFVWVNDIDTLSYDGHIPVYHIE